MRFDKNSPRKHFVDPIKKLEYDASSLAKASTKISNYKRVKGCVSMDKQKNRDFNMYGFDKQDMKALRTRLNVKNFKFSDTLPNNIKLRRPDSHVSMSSPVNIYSPE